MTRALMVFLACIAASAAEAVDVTGKARVLDGDTIEIGAEKIRLYGIDAPEGAQLCKNAAGRDYPCGEVAANRLRQLTAGKPITCKGDERDQYKRLIAVCSTEGRDINPVLVREGLAWAFVKYSKTYVGEEEEARKAKRGVFARPDNITPWDFRNRRWTDEEKKNALSRGCVIKGNISRTGERIYHMPWQKHYAKTKIDAKAGEQWFCNAGDAEKGGFRPSLQ